MSAAVQTRALGWAGAVVLGFAACTHDFQVSARNLQISPDTALPGDSVTFAFDLIVVPAQEFTINVLIDGTTDTSETRVELAQGPYVFNVGDAGDLILQYGSGTHEGAIEVRLKDGGRTATASRTFVLEETAPPLGTGP
jgi:hypothetical protein